MDNLIAHQFKAVRLLGTKQRRKSSSSPLRISFLMETDRCRTCLWKSDGVSRSDVLSSSIRLVQSAISAIHSAVSFSSWLPATGEILQRGGGWSLCSSLSEEVVLVRLVGDLSGSLWFVGRAWPRLLLIEKSPSGIGSAFLFRQLPLDSCPLLRQQFCLLDDWLDSLLLLVRRVPVLP